MAGKKTTKGSPSDANQKIRSATNKRRNIERAQRQTEKVLERHLRKGIVRGATRTRSRRMVQPVFTPPSDPVVCYHEMIKLAKTSNQN